MLGSNSSAALDQSPKPGWSDELHPDFLFERISGRMRQSFGLWGNAINPNAGAYAKIKPKKWRHHAGRPLNIYVTSGVK